MKAGIVACSDPLTPGFAPKLTQLCEQLRELHIEAVPSPYLFDRGDGFAAEGKARAKALMDLYRDPEVKWIFDISGGDMANEVLPYLDWEFLNSPVCADKVFWGYSDLTTIVNAMTKMTGRPSMLWQLRNLLYDYGKEQKARLAKSIEQEEAGNHYPQVINLQVEPADCNTSTGLTEISYHFLQGDAMEGILVGGNIRCFLKLAGTPFWPELSGKILLLESMGGGVPQMVTFLSQLKLLGVFEQVHGILLGTFSNMDAKGLQPDIETLVKSFAGPHLPIARTMEIGHGSDAKAARIGAYYRFAEKQQEEMARL